jgi:hypothetical protein
VGAAVTSHDNSKRSTLTGSALSVDVDDGTCTNYVSTDVAPVGTIGQKGSGELRPNMRKNEFVVKGSGAGEEIISAAFHSFNDNFAFR